MQNSGQVTGQAGLTGVLRRSALPAAAAALSAIVLAGQLGDVELQTISAALAAISPLAWMLALLASAASFLAVGQYDALFHGWLGTGVRQRRAAVSGAAAIALSQSLGFGLLTGTLARWRALPDMPLSGALTVTHYVSISFMGALGALSAVMVMVSGLSMPGSEVFNAVAVTMLLVSAILSFVPQGHLPFRFPPLRLLMRLLVLAAADTGLAALALWVLLPAGTGVGFTELAAAFLLALAAGFLSGTPGGIGPFEVCLIALLPAVPEPELIGSILAFRLVYHALPACIAVLVLARPAVPRGGARVAGPVTPIRRAEAGLAEVPGHRLLPLGQSHAVAGLAGPLLVAIGDPVSGVPFGNAELSALDRTAWREGLWPALYKVGTRSAVLARQTGWTVVAVSEEAWLDPQSFTTDGPKHAQLRRKLRQAAAAGLRIEAANTLPLEAMAEVAADWTARAGGERGFSMGQFDPDYMGEQRTYLSWDGARLVAFATFHMSAREWTLDLMRSVGDAPNGTMQAIVVRALEDAARSGLGRLSLAAMPLAEADGPLARIANRPEAKGLRRFKESFAPRTERLYAAAPNPLLLLLAGIAILVSIRFPAGRKSNALQPCEMDNAALQHQPLSGANIGATFDAWDERSNTPRRHGHELHDRA